MSTASTSAKAARTTLKHETVYGRLVSVHAEYAEMVNLLGHIKNLTEAQTQGANVDWKAVGVQISQLQAFQPAK